VKWQATDPQHTLQSQKRNRGGTSDNDSYDVEMFNYNDSFNNNNNNVRLLNC